MRKLTVVVVVCCALVSLSACHRVSEEDKVRKVVQHVQKAAEKKDIKEVLMNLSKDYRDPQGYDYDSIKGLLLGYFFQHQRIHAYIPSLDVTVQGGSATAHFDAVLTGAGAPGTEAPLMPNALGMYTFDVNMKNEEGDWKVTSAKWERTGTAQPGVSP